MSEPKSENLARLTTNDGKYFITAASWDPYGDGDESYEIGIRWLPDGPFKLIQARWHKDAVLKAATLICLGLNSGLVPSDFDGVFP